VVEAIVSRTMSKAPEARPSSAELVEELRQAEHMISTGSAMTAPDPYATQVMPRVSQADMERVRQEEEYEEEY
jgi:serine/threonine-protein kinase